MMVVNFFDYVNDSKLKFAVIIAQCNGKWVLCKHKQRDTWEFPGGHREPGESIDETARRELREESGAVEFTVTPVCAYSVTGKNRVNKTGEESFGMLYTAEIFSFEKDLHSEMERVELFSQLPDNWTYPEIQPKLLEEYLRRMVLKEPVYAAIHRQVFLI